MQGVVSGQVLEETMQAVGSLQGLRTLIALHEDTLGPIADLAGAEAAAHGLLLSAVSPNHPDQ